MKLVNTACGVSDAPDPEFIDEDSFQTSMTRFFGGRPRFRRNMLSNEKLVDVELPVVKVISLLPLEPDG